MLTFKTHVITRILHIILQPKPLRIKYRCHILPPAEGISPLHARRTARLYADTLPGRDPECRKKEMPQEQRVFSSTLGRTGFFYEPVSNYPRA